MTRCPHCNVEQFDNPNADPALDAMSDLCWKWARPLTVFSPCDEVREHRDLWRGVVLESDDGVTVVAIGDEVRRIVTMYLWGDDEQHG
jgi:hypothetical protein